MSKRSRAARRPDCAPGGRAKPERSHEQGPHDLPRRHSRTRPGHRLSRVGRARGAVARARRLGAQPQRRRRRGGVRRTAWRRGSDDRSVPARSRARACGGGRRAGGGRRRSRPAPARRQVLPAADDVVVDPAAENSMLPTASRASRLGEQIGYLSRYARILSGNRIFAADCVANLLTEAQDVKAGMQVRQLYRLFTDRYNRVQLFYRKSAADDPNDATAYCASPSRQAMLLVGLEQFSRQDAAYILDVDVPQLDDLIARGSREIADEAPADVLILHDEPITAMMWEDELRALGHRVLGIGRTRGDALALADKARP